MNPLNLSAIALALGLILCNSAMAESISKPQYKSQKNTIDAQYKTDKRACASLADNANDICIAAAKGKKSTAQAELEASYQPSPQHSYEAQTAKAEADYAVAIEKCDDKAGNDKDVCVKEAKADKVHQIADAKSKMKSTEANAEANDTSSAAQATAAEKKAEAHSDAQIDKRNADYLVAKEKCEVLANNAKDLCLSEAKNRFGK